MARGRAQLTEKQERILIQAQLMGLTPQDMQRISNRLIALQKEAEEIQKVGDNVRGYSWTRDDNKNWIVTTPDGHVCKFTKGKNKKTQWWETTYNYDVTVTKPGTAFKTRELKDRRISQRNEWRAKLLPEKNKELYGMIIWCGGLKWEIKS